jgi:Mrp family chromosome partitioning ATPase
VTGVCLAAPGLAQEPDLVGVLPARGLTVVRRCVDAVDLLAAAAADPSTVVLVSAALPRLSADVIGRLGGPARVVGLAEAADDEQRLRVLGVRTLVRTASSATGTADAVAAALQRDADPGPGVWPAGAPAPTTAVPPGAGTGRLVVVWGPMGAPGRTTVALGLAEALADRGHRVCSVDADTYAPSMALALGVVEDSSGLVVACRQAETGVLGADLLSGLTRRVAGTWHLLGGLPSADRWPDLRPGALDRVWSTCREEFDVTVVDVGFCLERDDDGTWARSRNAAALTALGGADHVVAVADGSAAGAARLAAAWPALAVESAGVPVTVVRNRAAGRDREWVRAVAACGVRAPVCAVPADPRGVARCWDRGRSLREGARRSPVRRALADLARVVVSG